MLVQFVLPFPFGPVLGKQGESQNKRNQTYCNVKNMSLSLINLTGADKLGNVCKVMVKSIVMPLQAFNIV